MIDKFSGDKRISQIAFMDICEEIGRYQNTKQALCTLSGKELQEHLKEVEAMIRQSQALQDLTNLSQEMGLYEQKKQRKDEQTSQI